MTLESLFKHFEKIIIDYRQCGFFFAFGNFLWFIRNKIPIKVYNAIQMKKHSIVEKKIIKTLEKELIKLPCIEQKRHSFAIAPIWVCWLQGEKKMPQIPQICLERIRKFSGSHPVKLITLDNYNEFVNLPQTITKLFKDKKICMAHFADILRTYLLYNYGGCWIDSTIYLTAPLDEKIFNYDFYSIKYNPNDNFYITQCRWSNFFMCCKPGNIIMGYTLNMFYKYLEVKQSFIDYFMMDYFMDITIQHSIIAKKQIENVPINNEKVLSLSKIINEMYNEDDFQELCRTTKIHKLSWRCSTNNVAEYTYLSHIIKQDV